MLDLQRCSYENMVFIHPFQCSLCRQTHMIQPMHAWYDSAEIFFSGEVFRTKFTLRDLIWPKNCEISNSGGNIFWWNLLHGVHPLAPPVYPASLWTTSRLCHDILTLEYLFYEARKSAAAFYPVHDRPKLGWGDFGHNKVIFPFESREKRFQLHPHCRLQKVVLSDL